MHINTKLSSSEDIKQGNVLQYDTIKTIVFEEFGVTMLVNLDHYIWNLHMPILCTYGHYSVRMP